MLFPREKAPFLEQMHKGPGYPQTVSPGDDEIIDIRVFIGEMFRERAGNTYSPHIRELEKEAGDLIGYQ